MIVNDMENGTTMITLVSDDERHALWHALNQDSLHVVEGSTENADHDTIEEVSYDMWNAFDNVHSDAEYSPKKATQVEVKKSGSKTYVCPVCNGKGKVEFGNQCDLCDGTGRIMLIEV